MIPKGNYAPQYRDLGVRGFRKTPKTLPLITPQNLQHPEFHVIFWSFCDNRKASTRPARECVCVCVWVGFVCLFIVATLPSFQRWVEGVRFRIRGGSKLITKVTVLTITHSRGYSTVNWAMAHSPIYGTITLLSKSHDPPSQVP